MDQPAQHSARTERSASPLGDRPSTAVPTYIAAILDLVRGLLGYGKHLDQVLPDQVSHKRFPTLAAGFGTHDLRRILAHVQRGILRAMMLQKYLLACAAQGRDIEPVQPPEPANSADIDAMDIKLRPPVGPRAKTPRQPRIDPDAPAYFVMPTMKELESQVRHRSVGRTIAEICLDLGIAATICEPGFWHELYLTLTRFGGSFEHVFGVQERRKQAFEKERRTRPETWTPDWRDRPRDAIRQLLGYVLGESPPRGPPISSLVPASP